MTEKIISPKEFEHGLQDIIGKKLTDFYYTTDSLVTFLAGKKFQNDKGTTDSEFDLMILGGWEYVKDGKTIETSIPQSTDENIPALRGRLDDLINNLHPTKINSISISDDGITAEIVLDNGGMFKVHGNDDMFLSFSHKTFDGDGKFISATHLRSDEETGKLMLVQAP